MIMLLLLYNRQAKGTNLKLILLITLDKIIVYER